MIPGQGGAIGLQDTRTSIQATAINQLVEQLVGVPAKGSILPFDQHRRIGSKAIAMSPHNRRFDHIVFGIYAEL